MKKLPPINEEHLVDIRAHSDDKSERVVQVTSLDPEVSQIYSDVISLELNYVHGPNPEKKLIIPLSPPAAKLIADHLNKLVCDYLSGMGTE